MRILLADDNEHTRLTTQAAMEHRGFTVEAAEDGAEALRRARRQPPDLIVSDTLMPCMDGFALCRAVKEDPLLKRIPVILFTASCVDPKNREMAHAAGAARILEELNDKEAICRIIEEMSGDASEWVSADVDTRVEHARSIPDNAEGLSRALDQKVEELEAERCRLQENEDLFRDVTEAASDWIWEMDADLKFTYLSQRFYELTGIRSEEVVGRRRWELGVNRNEERWKRHQELVKRHEPFRDFIYRTSISDTRRQQHFFKISGKPIYDKRGQFAGYRGVGTDITEQIEAGAALQESRRALARLMRNLPGMAYRCAPNSEWGMHLLPGEFTRQTGYHPSIGFFKLTGYHPLQLIRGRHIAYVDLIHPEDRRRAQDHIQTAVHEHRPYQTSYRIRTALGDEKWVLEQGCAVYSAEGDLLLLEGLILDISEQKRAELALQESQERYRLIVDTALDAVVSMDANGCIVGWNAHAEKIFGYSKSEVMGRPLWRTIVPMQHRAAHRRGLSNFLATGEGPYVNRRIEITGLHKEGYEFPVELAAVPLRTGDSITFSAFIRDIQDRKEAEERLRRSEEQLRLTLENAPIGIATANLDGRISSVNPSFCAITGYSPEELLQKTIRDIVHPADYRETLSKHFELLRGVIPRFELEQRYIRKGGTEITALTHVGLVRDANGTPLMAVGDLEDITERKQTELALRTLAESAVVADENDFLIRCVSSLSQIYGCRYAAVGIFDDETRTSLRLIASWNGGTFGESVVYSLPGTPCHDVLRGETELVLGNVQELYPEDGYLAEKGINSYFGAPLITSSGEVIGVVCVMDTRPLELNTWTRPVLGVFASRLALEVQRKQAEEEMVRMRLHLKNIIDSMPSVLIGVDANESITEWNQKAEQLTGLSLSEARGRQFSAVLPEFSSHQELLQKAIQTGQTSKTERVTSKVGGDTRHVDVMVYPLAEKGTVGAVIRIDDVTARVRIEEMMVQTEKMLSVGGLAAGMAHEINNPLGAVLQSCQNITRRLSTDLEKNNEVAEALGLDLHRVAEYLEQRDILRFLDGINEAGKRAAHIVSDMLSFSRRSEPSFTPADLQEMLEISVRLAASDYDLRKRIDFQNIEIERDYDPTLTMIHCDKTEIEQVLLNLLKNSAQAMADCQPGHKITLRTRREPDYARIEVVDNGAGMDEATRRRVFEPFFTTKEVGIGTGLGLSVSYFIVTEQHRGTMAVHSAPNQGTRFIVRIPLRE